MKIVKHIIEEPEYIAVKLITNDCLGIIQYSFNDKNNYVYIYGFSVENNSRGKHIGTELFEYCLNEINSLNKKDIHLTVNKNNTRLINFYKRYGFIVVNDNYEDYYVYMIKRLNNEYRKSVKESKEC